MASQYKSAVVMATEILATYRELHGEVPFPTIKGKLMPLIEARATVDNIYVKRFKDTMNPIVGQMRRIEESNGVYQSVEQHGVIYLCPSLDLDWQRFIMIKEASHLLLDKPGDYVQSATDIDRLMVCLAQFGAEETTKHYASEQNALVCAYELLFPKATRDKLLAKYAAGQISPAAISKLARIPVETVRVVMGERYTDLISPIYAELAVPQLKAAS